MPFLFIIALAVLLTLMLMVRRMNKRAISRGRKMADTLDKKELTTSELRVASEGCSQHISTLQTMKSQSQSGPSFVRWGTSAMFSMENLEKTWTEFNEGFNKEDLVLRILQVVLFFLSYGAANFVTEKSDWQGRLAVQVLKSIFAIAIFAALLRVLPRYVPRFSAVMSLPPYVNRDNIHVLIYVLESIAAKKHHSPSGAQTDPGVAPFKYEALPEGEAGDPDTLM